jgi:acyl-CoA thioester hydrolase
MDPFVYSHRIRYHETDAQHHVFNARYLEYVDVAMTEFIRELGWDYPDLVAGGCDPAVVHVEMDFHRPASFDQEVGIAVAVERVGGSSFTLAYDMRLDGDPVASATVVYVNYDVAGEQARPLPGAVRERLERYRRGDGH